MSQITPKNTHTKFSMDNGFMQHCQRYAAQEFVTRQTLRKHVKHIYIASTLHVGAKRGSTIQDISCEFVQQN